MKALVTGGSGFIGSHIADRLLKEGYEVRILDNLELRVHPKGIPKWMPRDAEFIYGDVRDKGKLKRALEDVKVIFHQAAYQDYMQDFSKFLHVNSVSTALLIEIIAEFQKQGFGSEIKKLVIASSQAVYGEGQYRCRNVECSLSKCPVVQPQSRTIEQLKKGQWKMICPECKQPMESLLLCEGYHNPFNAYAISKLSEEMTAIRLGKLNEIPTVALRYSIVQGPRQSLYNQYSGICRIFCLRLLNNLPPIIYEDGYQKRDYTHIKDVVEANMIVLKDPRANYRVFNVGSGLETTVLEYAKALSHKLGKKLEPNITGEYRVGDNRHSVSDTSKLQTLGWKPQYGLDDIFEDYISWIHKHCDLGKFFVEAENTMRKQGVVRSVVERS